MIKTVKIMNKILIQLFLILLIYNSIIKFNIIFLKIYFLFFIYYYIKNINFVFIKN